MTRDVREAMTGIQTSLGQTSDALLRLEQASESLAITTDHLVALAEEATKIRTSTETRTFRARSPATRGSNRSAAPTMARCEGPGMGSRVTRMTGRLSSHASKRHGLLGARLATP